MAELSNKIDFVLLVSVKMANPNGDPLNGNRPRQSALARAYNTSELP